MADGIVTLYADDARLKRISQRGREYVAVHFTAEKIKTAFESALHEL